MDRTSEVPGAFAPAPFAHHLPRRAGHSRHYPPSLAHRQGVNCYGTRYLLGCASIRSSPCTRTYESEMGKARLGRASPLLS